MPVPTYRERLRTEGASLAACGAAGSVGLWCLAPSSRRWPYNTLGQLAVTSALTHHFGTRSVRKSMDAAVEAQPGGEGTGEPTPLWQIPLIMLGLASFFALLRNTSLPGAERAGLDASLRVTGGCVVTGVMQAVVYEKLVPADETARGRRYFRGAGSKLIGGTKLVYTRA